MVMPPRPPSTLWTLTMVPDSTATSGDPSSARRSLPLCWREQPSRKACQLSVKDTSTGAAMGKGLVSGGWTWGRAEVGGLPGGVWAPAAVAEAPKISVAATRIPTVSGARPRCRSPDRTLRPPGVAPTAQPTYGVHARVYVSVFAAGRDPDGSVTC